MSDVAGAKKDIVKLPEDIGLKLENILLKEQILTQKQELLQKEISDLQTFKKRYITQLQQQLDLPVRFEIDLANQCIRTLHGEEEQSG